MRCSPSPQKANNGLLSFVLLPFFSLSSSLGFPGLCFVRVSLSSAHVQHRLLGTAVTKQKETTKTCDVRQHENMLNFGFLHLWFGSLWAGRQDEELSIVS